MRREWSQWEPGGEEGGVRRDTYTCWNQRGLGIGLILKHDVL